MQEVHQNKVVPLLFPPSGTHHKQLSQMFYPSHPAPAVNGSVNNVSLWPWGEIIFDIKVLL